MWELTFSKRLSKTFVCDKTGDGSDGRERLLTPEKLIPNLQEREFFIGNLLVRIHFSIEMIRWTGLALWEFSFSREPYTYPQIGDGSYGCECVLACEGPTRRDSGGESGGTVSPNPEPETSHSGFRVQDSGFRGRLRGKSQDWTLGGIAKKSNWKPETRAPEPETRHRSALQDRIMGGKTAEQ